MTVMVVIKSFSSPCDALNRIHFVYNRFASFGNNLQKHNVTLNGSLNCSMEILSKYSPIPSDIILFGRLVTIPPIILLSRYNEAG